MDKQKFRVIKGTKSQPIDRKYVFLEGHVTNTRLMGVIGLHVKWEREDGELFHQFFHLDAEEYGLDDYASVLGEEKETVETVIARMMGGLGGEFVSVNEKEVRYLIKTFVEKNKVKKESLPEPEWEYAFILNENMHFSEEETHALWDKICEKIHSPIQLVNYFIMRAVGTDYEALSYLSTGGIDYKPVKKPSILLKNVIEMVDEKECTGYIAESLIDVENHYKMMISEIKVIKTEAGFRVEKAEIRSSMKITSTEAAFALNRKEHLLIYHVKDIVKALRLVDQQKPHAMKHIHELGYLYTEFNPTNEHVNRKAYYLNEDIYAVYYITTGDQLIAAAYDQEKIEEIQSYLKGDLFEGIFELEECIDLDNSLLYEFVHSDCDNIFDFLDEE